MKCFRHRTSAWVGFFIFFAGVLTLAAQTPWQHFEGARLLVEENRDGDSFMVEFVNEGVKQRQMVRLYFVDCPESAAAVDSDRRRVVEQMRYFGLEAPEPVLDAGVKAAEFTRAILEKPFTLHTAFASAPGRSARPRIYAMITTSEGRDLGAALVEAGWGRNRGVSRRLPDGTPGVNYATRLGDLEAGAMLARRGIWEFADAARIAELREEERAEARQLQNYFGNAEETSPIVLNSATAVELQTLPGVGPAISERILARRPFTSIEELTGVQGISAEMLERWRERLTLE